MTDKAESSAQAAKQAELQAEIEALRKRIAALEESEAELKAYLAAMNDVVMVTDWEGRVLKIAQTNTDLLVGPAHELLGKTLHQIVPKDLADLLLSNVRVAIDTKQPVSVEYTLTLGDQQRLCFGSISPMPEGRALFSGRDVTERMQMENALRKRQDEVIRAQAAALAELSTPLIPITDDIVVMPLIGTVDSQRAQQVMSTLLQGIVERRASVAILDITGVSVVDTQVANAIIQAARAARLLGASVMLTGIRPDVSRTLVGIGVELQDIDTHGTLQGAIARAMERGAGGEEPDQDLD